MARGTDFGGVHSHRDLNLIQQSVDIQPAEPKTNFIDIPGADGSKDKSELPGGRVVYNDRTLSWTFALYPGEDWHAKHRQVSNALNGKRCKITLDDDPDWFYTGRLVVRDYNTDRLLRQITVEATCNPWMLKQEPTVVGLALTTALKTLVLSNVKKPAVPTIVVTAETVIEWNNKTATLAPGSSFTSLDIELLPGDNILKARTTSGAGKITITYQEGSL